MIAEAPLKTGNGIAEILCHAVIILYRSDRVRSAGSPVQVAGAQMTGRHLPELRYMFQTDLHAVRTAVRETASLPGR